MSDLGDRLKRARQARPGRVFHTQADAAECIPCTVKTVHETETGKTQRHHAATAVGMERYCRDREGVGDEAS